MPVGLQKEHPVPNIAYAPMILIQTGILDGKLRTSCQVHLAGACVENIGQPEETWAAAGQGEMVHIPDLANLEPDLAGLAPQVAAVYAGIIALIAELNEIRKVI